MTEILTEQIDTEDQYRVVRLSSKYTQYGFREMHARMDADTGAHFTFVRDEHKPKHFDLSIEEVNALVAAWLKFEDDVETAKVAEEERKAGVLAKAMQLAQDFQPEHEDLHVKVTQHEYQGKHYYNVRVKAIDFERTYTANADHLLAEVKEAFEQIETHIVWLEEKVLPHHLHDEHEAAVRNREMVAAYRAVKPKSPASSDIAPEAESEEAMF